MSDSAVKKSIPFSQLPEKVREILNQNARRDVVLMEICELLEESVPFFDWVGFYLVDPNEDRKLVLGPFVGEPTDHIMIDFGEGICGQAADLLETFVVQDVSKEDNYLSCSPTVKSEIVVPVLKNDEIVAELDIDSHTIHPFTDEHQQILEEICRDIATVF